MKYKFQILPDKNELTSIFNIVEHYYDRIYNLKCISNILNRITHCSGYRCNNAWIGMGGQKLSKNVVHKSFLKIT